MPTTAPPQQIILKDIFNLPNRADSLQWEYFRPGIKIHRLYGNPDNGPSAALLWYEPGTGVPRHEHLGYEHIFILSNSQSDESGDYPAGTLIINPPQSAHTVSARRGGIALLIWERPVKFHE
jgi:anti-sigma factor ChrR (cupin superfamily)